MKSVEKKLKDEINMINGHKAILRDKITQMEHEVNTFVS